jgi:hypothetical protein
LLNVAFVCCRTCPLSLDFSFLPTFFLSFFLALFLVKGKGE